MLTRVTSCHMLVVDLLEAWDRTGGQVPNSVEHVSGVDAVVVCDKGIHTSAPLIPLAPPLSFKLSH